MKKILLNGFVLVLSLLQLNAQKADAKYPDIVVEAYYSGYFDVFEQLYGGEGINYPMIINPNNILGENKTKWFVSLPKDSYIILQFTDNEIIDAPDQNDIEVIEHGCCDEWAEVYVSHDGKKFIYLGLVDDCDKRELDLATIDFKQPVRYVKVVGVDVRCASPGYDLVSVVPLPGANRELYAGMEMVDDYFEEVKIDKTLILENVYFDIDQYEIRPDGIDDLNKIILKLKEFPEIMVSIWGHTDSVADENYNLVLSLKRANAVKDYLIRNGIAENRIMTEGFGETVPLRTNETAEGRAFNRRVELRRRN